MFFIVFDISGAKSHQCLFCRVVYRFYSLWDFCTAFEYFAIDYAYTYEYIYTVNLPLLNVNLAVRICIFI